MIDIIAVLVDQPDFNRAKSYWTTLKNRLKMEGSEVVTNCDRLKMTAQDGKMRETDVADVETLLRIVQTVPSKNVEPIKRWLARVGYEGMVEINNPEKALDRSRAYWERGGWLHFVPTARVTFGRPKVTKSRWGSEFAWEARCLWEAQGRTTPQTPWYKMLFATKYIRTLLVG